MGPARHPRQQCRRHAACARGRSRSRGLAPHDRAQPVRPDGTTKAALPHLKAAKGHIVNVSSVAGRVANPGASGYAATKFGVVAFSESLRREVYADKVRVTVIEPGLVRTELGDHITNEEFKAGLEHRLATMEALTAEDIANAILYAVSQPPHVNVNEILIRPTDQER
ncbi:hypothetical protein MPLB_960018 [Mesorhizobium sp. ORS 3324]|nr:hypothetical protein MPLB_960018 [Mesorhizobium sp. ORS 3324]